MSSLDDLIAEAAKRLGMGHRADWMRRTIHLESKGKADAFNAGSKAAGLLQFIPSTAKDYGLDDPYDPAKAIDAGFRYAKANEAHLAKVLGRAPTDAELYMAHNQGAGGAEKLLTQGDKAATALLGRGAVTSNYGGTDADTAYDYAAKLRAAYDGATPGTSATPSSTPDVPQSRLTPEQLAALLGGGKKKAPAQVDGSKLSSGGAFAAGFGSEIPDHIDLAKLFTPKAPAGPGNSMTSTGLTDAAMGNANQGDWDFAKPAPAKTPIASGLAKLLSLFG